MRLLIITALGAAIGCSPAAADDRFCQLQSQIAARLMEARQNGTPLARMLAINAEMGGPAEERTLYDEIAIRAYEAPRFETEARKVQIGTEFSNEIMIACYRGLSSVN